MSTTTTVGGGPQCMRALQRANEVRLARAELKRRIAEGRVSAAEVILQLSFADRKNDRERAPDEPAALGPHPLPQVSDGRATVGKQDRRFDD